MSLTIPTSNTGPTISEIVPVQGSGLVAGHRFLVQNPMTGEKHWTSPITHFTTPRLPQRADNRQAMPPAGTRIAWAGSFRLGEIRPGVAFLVLPTVTETEDTWLFGGGQ